MKQKIFVANWKMQKSFNQSVKFVTKNLDELKKTNALVVLCPSFPALYPMAQALKNTSVHIGAQNCSPHKNGAYTGQVSAQSLAEVGCTYCIVGHSERRKYNKESDSEVAQKTEQLIIQNIIPIVCIGESAQEFEKKQTIDVLANQLKPVFSTIKTTKNAIKVCIAYEPIWSIGTGKVPNIDYLKSIFETLQEWFNTQIPKIETKLLYGGSVNEKNILQFNNIPQIEGFLIGGSSLDFQKLKKIVS